MLYLEHYPDLNEQIMKHNLVFHHKDYQPQRYAKELVDTYKHCDMNK